MICRANQVTGFYMLGTLVVKGLIEVGGKGFLSKDFIKIVTEDLVSKPPDNRYPMQAYLGGYASNINNIQKLLEWDIQQTQIYSIGMV